MPTATRPNCSTKPACVVCRAKDATRVVMHRVNGSLWSRRVCDGCATNLANIESNKEITR